jgi:transcriptional regulator with XRE-family HTH domain
VAGLTTPLNTQGMVRSSVTPRLSADIRHRLALNIRLARERLGLSQERLAYEAGIDRTMLSKIERRVSNPSLDTLLKIAGRLGLDITDLLQPVAAAAEAEPPPRPKPATRQAPARPLNHGGRPRTGPR